MYLTIMKPQALQQIAVLARGLWIVEGPEGSVLVIKAGKELILAAQQRRELKLYLAPYKVDETTGLPYGPPTGHGGNFSHNDFSYKT